MPAVLVLSVNEYLVGHRHDRWQSCMIVDMAAGLYALILLFNPSYILLFPKVGAVSLRPGTCLCTVVPH